MTYKLLAFGVQRIEDGACIPADLGNVDWQKYQAFLATGGVALPADPAQGPDNGAALDQSRLDALRKEIDSKIGSLSEDQQVIFRSMLKLIDKEI